MTDAPTCLCREPIKIPDDLRDIIRYAEQCYEVQKHTCAIGEKQHMHEARLEGLIGGLLSVMRNQYDREAGLIGTAISRALPLDAQAPHHMGMLAPWGDEPAPSLAWILRGVERLVSSRAMAIEALGPNEDETCWNCEMFLRSTDSGDSGLCQSCWEQRQDTPV